MRRTAVAVVGAGPYGLGVAAHLAGRGIDHLVIGRAMSSWVEHMPVGGFLKSEAFASSIGDPAGTHTLEAYLRAEGLPYRAVGVPVSRDLFAEYGRWFQRTLVPGLLETEVTRLERAPGGFALTLADGDTVEAAAVVVAIGMARGAVIPPVLADGLGDRVSHSVTHVTMDRFAGQEVAVIGGGQSALETCALLAEAGARPTLLVRESHVSWAGQPTERSLVDAIRKPQTPLGPDPKLWAYTNAMGLYRFFPADWRVDRGWWAPAGPEGAWWLRHRVEGIVPTCLSHETVASRLDGDRAALDLKTPDGPRTMAFDHVIAATGYRFRLESQGILDDALRAEVRLLHGAPHVSPSFMTSVPGLFFAGAATTGDFGPAMRFVFGSDFAGRRIARALA